MQETSFYMKHHLYRMTKWPLLKSGCESWNLGIYTESGTLYAQTIFFLSYSLYNWEGKTWSMTLSCAVAMCVCRVSPHVQLVILVLPSKLYTTYVILQAKFFALYKWYLAVEPAVSRGYGGSQLV